MFAVTLPPGPNVLRVRYRTPASAAVAPESRTRFWQFAYVLAPARDWGGFGELSVRVQLPPGWEAASSLPLDRDGDDLIGSFRGIPADALALTARLPSAPVQNAIWLYQALGLAGLAIALLIAAYVSDRVGAATGRAAARKGKSSFYALPSAILVGMLWALLCFYGVNIITIQPYRWTVPAGQDNWQDWYNQAMLFPLCGLPLGFLGFLTGLILTQQATARASQETGAGEGALPPQPSS